MAISTHPWFMSCSVSSSHILTWMALPSLMKWKMSSMSLLRLVLRVTRCQVTSSLMLCRVQLCPGVPSTQHTQPKLVSLEYSQLSAHNHVTSQAAGGASLFCLSLASRAMEL